MFAHQPQSNYASETRSIRLGGHSTSIRLENVFWHILEEIAAREGSTVAKFITKLHDEVMQHHNELSNIASLLRCSCLIYASQAALPLEPLAARDCPSPRMVAAE
jgi:predicted DNA-binding ribbon-helix-helix protein